MSLKEIFAIFLECPYKSLYTSASRSVFKLPRVIARGVSCPKFLAMTNVSLCFTSYLVTKTFISKQRLVASVSKKTTAKYNGFYKMRGFYICMDLNNATKFTGSEISDPAEILQSKSKDRNMFVNHNQSERRPALATIACKIICKVYNFRLCIVAVTRNSLYFCLDRGSQTKGFLA